MVIYMRRGFPGWETSERVENLGVAVFHSGSRYMSFVLALQTGLDGSVLSSKRERNDFLIALAD